MEADRRIALALLHARNERLYPRLPRLPFFRLATPHGNMDFCREHIDNAIDNAIASLPPEWISGWAYREPVPVEADDVPF